MKTKHSVHQFCTISGSQNKWVEDEVLLEMGFKISVNYLILLPSRDGV